MRAGYGLNQGRRVMEIEFEQHPWAHVGSVMQVALVLQVSLEVCWEVLMF